MSAAPTLDAKRSGLYRAPASVQALHRAAQAAGLIWLDMPLAAVTNKDQFLALAKKQMKLPAHFGENWDALADCLRDFAWLKAQGYVLHMTDGGKFAKAAPGDYQTALDVLAEAAAFWKGKATPFVVLVACAKDLPAY
ncbi:MAG: barstar family protein [Betaproteobacteria bacterium]|nr:barstar family protein [Betaproteobacteria bacterium]